MSTGARMQIPGEETEPRGDPAESAIRSLHPRAFSARLPDGHAVQFYESAEFLCAAIATFLEEGFAAGESAIVLMTPSRRRDVERLLRSHGTDVDRLVARGQLVVFDAEEGLGRICVGNLPSPSAFGAFVGPILESALRVSPARRVRAYGEMVDVLWQSGNKEGALHLEELWNDLRQRHPFTLLCAYSMGGLEREDDIRRICKTHGHVLPPEGHASEVAAGSESRYVRTLTAEIARRTDVEKTLRESIQDLRRTEQELAQSQNDADRFARVTAALADAVTQDQVFEAIVDQVAAALHASTAALWTAEDGEAALHLVRSVGYTETARSRFRTVALDTEMPFPALDAFRSGTPVWIDSQQELLQRYPHLAADVVPRRNYRIACLPIASGGNVLGAIGFTFEEAPLIDDDERRFLMVVARYSGQALERLRLVRDNVHARSRAELLYRLAASVIEANHIDDVYRAALDAIERALHTTRSAALVFDDRAVMRFKAWRGLSDEYRRAVEGHSPWPRDVKSPEPIVVPSTAEDESLHAFGPLFEKEGIASLAFIPLVASGRLIGKFMVYYPERRQLSPQELEVGRAIANHVAAAIARFAAVGELEETVRFNEMFTAILGHDLRNPLGAIMTAAQLIGRRADNEKLLKPVGRIMSSGERMARMIDQLLDFTRVRVGAGIPLRPKQMDLVPVLSQIFDELDDAHPNWALRLEQSGDTDGVWDEDRLGQVFSNLVGNALQYGVAEHGVRVRIDGADADTVKIEVHNMGAVPEALIPNLFEPMTGGDRRREKSHGLGLGLFISRQIVKAHGGTLEVQSTEGDGTLFAVTLPRTVTGVRESRPK